MRRWRGLLLAAVANSGIERVSRRPELSIIRETGIDLRVLGFTVVVCLSCGNTLWIAAGVARAHARFERSLEARRQRLCRTWQPPRSQHFGRRRDCARADSVDRRGLLLQSFRHLLDVAPGFQTDHLLSMQIDAGDASPGSSKQSHRSAAIGTRQEAGAAVRSDRATGKCFAGREIGGRNFHIAARLRNARGFAISHRGPADLGRGNVRPVAQTRVVTPEYFATVGIPLMRGRLLTRDDWTLQDKIVINETIANRFFASEDPDRSPAEFLLARSEALLVFDCGSCRQRAPVWIGCWSHL